MIAIGLANDDDITAIFCVLSKKLHFKSASTAELQT
jgi:hypothetical protein